MISASAIPVVNIWYLPLPFVSPGTRRSPTPRGEAIEFVGTARDLLADMSKLGHCLRALLAPYPGGLVRPPPID